jgi:hypothetical protein
MKPLAHKKTANTVTSEDLQAEADAARERVSGYSDEKRSELEAHARGVMHSAKSTVCCS